MYEGFVALFNLRLPLFLGSIVTVCTTSLIVTYSVGAKELRGFLSLNTSDIPPMEKYKQVKQSRNFLSELCESFEK